MSALSSKTAPSVAAHKPITYQRERQGKQKNEIFVDILERLNVLFSPNGYVLNSTVDGCIQMKSYLAGNPELRLALNEDLVIGKGGAYGSVTLDDCNFHECVQLQVRLFFRPFVPPCVPPVSLCCWCVSPCLRVSKPPPPPNGHSLVLYWSGVRAQPHPILHSPGR